jgi:hypothetical protein
MPAGRPAIHNAGVHAGAPCRFITLALHSCT